MRPNLFISRVLSLLLITLSGLSLEVRAQERVFDYEKGKATDYFKFNDDGTLCAAKKTFDNGAVFEMVYYKKRSEGETKVALYYECGDEIDFTRLLHEKPNELDILVSRPEDHFDPSGMDLVNINDWFKGNIMNSTSAPYLIQKSVFGIKSEKIPVFKVMLEDKTLITIRDDAPDIAAEFVSGERFRYHPKAWQYWSYIEEIKKDFPDYVVIASKGVDNANGTDVEGSIIYKNGQTYKGQIHLIADNASIIQSPNKSIVPYSTASRYTPKSLGYKVLGILKNQGYPIAFWIDNITSAVPLSGSVVDAKGNVVDIYRDGQKLDEFDKMQAIAEEQGKINKEKERVQNAIAQKQELTRKYGEKNTNALYAGNIITGMPEELFVIGLAGHMFKNVFTATISIQNGEDRCYDLYQFDQNTFSMKQLGFVWVIDKKVSSIVYY